jgi:hypothetical protein
MDSEFLLIAVSTIIFVYHILKTRIEDVAV